MSESDDQICLRCIYHGRVQGVGFRATTASIAALYPVKGYVRNQADGTVEILVAGSPAAVMEFRDEVARRMVGYIVRVEEEPAEPPPVDAGFRIRYS